MGTNDAVYVRGDMSIECKWAAEPNPANSIVTYIDSIKVDEKKISIKKCVNKKDCNSYCEVVCKRTLKNDPICPTLDPTQKELFSWIEHFDAFNQDDNEKGFTA